MVDNVWRRALRCLPQMSPGEESAIVTSTQNMGALFLSTRSYAIDTIHFRSKTSNLDSTSYTRVYE